MEESSSGQLRSTTLASRISKHWINYVANLNNNQITIANNGNPIMNSIEKILLLNTWLNNSAKSYLICISSRYHSFKIQTTNWNSTFQKANKILCECCIYLHYSSELLQLNHIYNYNLSGNTSILLVI